VDASSLGNGNLLVTGPNGFSQAATLVSLNAPGNGSPRTATYRITPPGGAWDFNDFGDYVASLKAGQVKDVAANAAPPAALGWFRVGIAPTLTTPDLFDSTDSGVSNTDNITNFDNSTPARAPKFTLFTTLSGATVTLYADGVPFGSAVASCPLIAGFSDPAPGPEAEAAGEPGPSTTFKWASMPSFLCESSPTGQ